MNQRVKGVIFVALSGGILFSNLIVSDAEEEKTGVFSGGFQGRPYTICIPHAYKGAIEGKRWPLIVGLHWHHGDGERLLKLFQNHLLYGSFVMVCPNGTNESWSEEDEPFVLALVEEMKGKYKIDPNRVFLMGVSAGAHFTYHVGLKHPELFRAIAVYAGSLAASKKRWGTPLAKEKEKQIPVFIMHGEKDELLPLWNATWSRDALKKEGYDVTYVEIPWQSHDVPQREVYQILDWFEKN